MSNSNLWNKIWTQVKDDTEFQWWVQRENRGVRGRKIISYINKYLGNISRLKTIEVGAGTGVYSFIFAKRGAAVTLLDYSQEAFLLAQNYFVSRGLSASFVYADALSLDGKLKSKFDVAMSFGTLEHFRYPERLLMAKVHFDLVRPGGVVIIGVPNRWFLIAEILQFYLQQSGKWHFGYSESFSRQELLKLGNELGLKKIEIQGSSLTTDILRYLLVIQQTRTFQKIFHGVRLHIPPVDFPGFFDNTLGADIFLMACKPNAI